MGFCKDSYVNGLTRLEFSQVFAASGLWNFFSSLLGSLIYSFAFLFVTTAGKPYTVISAPNNKQATLLVLRQRSI